MGFVPFSFIDLLDIFLVAVIMYWIYRMRSEEHTSELQSQR